MSVHVPARELDLRKADYLLDTNTVTDRMNALPGFKTSAAFFTFLRANLVLPPTSTHSAMSSSASTPLLNASSSQTLPPPPPAQLSTNAAAPAPSTPGDRFSQIPPLVTEVLTSTDRIDGLKLIADSVAQQRQAASRALIFSAPFAAIWALMVAIIVQLQWKTRGDIGIVLTTVGGGTMALLLICRLFTGGYLSEAEKIGLGFLESAEPGSEEVLIGSKYGDEVIGALALRLERAGTAKKKKGTKGGKGVVRAWTVVLRYRHKGIGTGLLEEAVKISREALGRDVEIGFAADHANSKMILPEFFNGGFRRDEKKAIAMLERVVAESDVAGKKK